MLVKSIDHNLTLKINAFGVRFLKYCAINLPSFRQILHLEICLDMLCFSLRRGFLYEARRLTKPVSDFVEILAVIRCNIKAAATWAKSALNPSQPCLISEKSALMLALLWPRIGKIHMIRLNAPLGDIAIDKARGVAPSQPHILKEEGFDFAGTASGMLDMFLKSLLYPSNILRRPLDAPGN